MALATKLAAHRELANPDNKDHQWSWECQLCCHDNASYENMCAGCGYRAPLSQIMDQLPLQRHRVFELAFHLKRMGFLASELAQEGGFHAAVLKTAHFSPADMKSAGFTPQQLYGAGFDGMKMTPAWTHAELLEAGYKPFQINCHVPGNSPHWHSEPNETQRCWVAGIDRSSQQLAHQLRATGESYTADLIEFFRVFPGLRKLIGGICASYCRPALPPGQHQAGTTWFYGTHLAGSVETSRRRNLWVVHGRGRKTEIRTEKTLGDGVTGFAVLAKRATMVMQHLTFTNLHVHNGMFLWEHCRLVCRHVHFTAPAHGSEASIVTANQPNTSLLFVECTFAPGCRLHVNAGTEVLMQSCAGARPKQFIKDPDDKWVEWEGNIKEII